MTAVLDAKPSPLEFAVTAAGFLGVATSLIASCVDFVVDFASTSATEILLDPAAMPALDLPSASLAFLALPVAAFVSSALRTLRTSQDPLVSPGGAQVLARFDEALAGAQSLGVHEALEFHAATSELRPALLAALVNLRRASDEGATSDELELRAAEIELVVAGVEQARRDLEDLEQDRTRRSAHVRSAATLAEVDVTTMTLGMMAEDITRRVRDLCAVEEEIGAALDRVSALVASTADAEHETPNSSLPPSACSDPDHARGLAYALGQSDDDHGHGLSGDLDGAVEIEDALEDEVEDYGVVIRTVPNRQTTLAGPLS